jgi:transmembrane 9 superfamily member 1
MALAGLFNVHRHGAMNAASFLVYALTSCVAGFVSTRLYVQLEGQVSSPSLMLAASLVVSQ